MSPEAQRDMTSRWGGAGRRVKAGRKTQVRRGEGRQASCPLPSPASTVWRTSDRGAGGGGCGSQGAGAGGGGECRCGNGGAGVPLPRAGAQAAGGLPFHSGLGRGAGRNSGGVAFRFPLAGGGGLCEKRICCFLNKLSQTLCLCYNVIRFSAV